MHEVWRHPGGAKLWMSGEKSGFDAHEYGVKTAFLLGSWQPSKLPGAVEVVNAPLADTEPSRAEATELSRTAHDLAARVVVRLASGKDVLVSCDSGLNRSGLVCALAMVASGVEPDEAVDAIRRRRSDAALRNAAFVEIVRSARKAAS